MSLGTGNEYAMLVERIQAPKKVWMALAVSLEMQRIGAGTLDADSLVHNLMAEWQILYDNGIVKQRPRKDTP